MSDADPAENAERSSRTGTTTSSPQNELREDEIVTKLVRDGTPPTGLIVLFGFLGKTAEQGRWRLYQNPALSEWVEFLQSDVLYQQQFPPPEGGTRVWLKPNALTARGRTSGAEHRATFLQGDIAANTPTRPTVLSGTETPADPDITNDPDCPRSMAGCHNPIR
jgi:hypothetical protein